MNTTPQIMLHEKCVEICSKRVCDLKDVLQETQHAANNETKSSAGDKHETGRAMAQLETEKLTKQLTEALKLEQILSRIDPKEKRTSAGLGSLIITNKGSFYLAVSLGKVTINDQDYFVISNQSPVGKLLMGKKANDAFTFNNQNYIIEKIDVE